MARVDDPAGLEARLNRIPEVIECGLFVGQTDILIVGTSNGVEVHTLQG
jgi:ribose 5-phosphate isomerase A